MAAPPPMPSSFEGHSEFSPESTTQRLWRRLREEPLIPIGMGLTVAAFIGASRAMRQNDHRRANIMFRRRLYAQGFTVVALVMGGAYYKKDREERKKFDEADKERQNIVKREKWIAELEARDREDQEAKERVQRLKEKRRLREESIKERIKADDLLTHDSSSKPPDQ